MIQTLIKKRRSHLYDIILFLVHDGDSFVLHFKDDDHDAEEWERYEAFHEDVDKQVSTCNVLCMIYLIAFKSAKTDCVSVYVCVCMFDVIGTYHREIV